MIKYTTGNILEATTEALVNTVNCVGIMGRGIALQFKKQFPENFVAYQKACANHELQPGKMFVFTQPTLKGTRYIINFPTKRHWRGRSRMEDIQAGLLALKQVIIEHNIQSIAIPPLGCGLGGLSWSEVKPLIEKELQDLTQVQIIVYEPAANITHIRAKQVPHLTPCRAALLVLMNRYLEGLLDPFVTLLEIHKLMYFLQESGQPLRLEYTKALYGPYAVNLRHVLNLLEDYYIKGYEGEDNPNTDISLLPGAKEEASQLLQSQPQLSSHIQKVSDLVNGFETSFGLELLSTVHWVIKKEHKQQLSDIIEAVYGWNEKKRKFSEEQIKIAHDTLKQYGWV